jgi:hypothetical protein
MSVLLIRRRREAVVAVNGCLTLGDPLRLTE